MCSQPCHNISVGKVTRTSNEFIFRLGSSNSLDDCVLVCWFRIDRSHLHLYYLHVHPDHPLHTALSNVLNTLDVCILLVGNHQISDSADQS